MSAGAQAFAEFVKPQLMDKLRAIGLDVEYHRAEGDRLYYQAAGREVEVLDFVGGFGAALLGHNHPEISAAARAVLDQRRPFHVQASARGGAGLLGRRLSERVGRATGRSYRVTFANSGTEAVEAAIKHAEMERRARTDAILARLTARSHEVRSRLRDQSAHLPESLFQDATRAFGLDRVQSLDDLLLRLFRMTLDAVERPPLFLAVEGAFHGKTSGSVKLTHNVEYQAPWRAIGPHSVFVPAGDAAALVEVLARAEVPYLELEIEPDGTVRLARKRFCNVAACFVEPIQGEGGVREIDEGTMRALRAAADQGGFPLVIDEVQSGMGRTGRFLASEAAGVRGDYYLLSKALGGGLAKISALLVDQARYLPEFGYLHTSTFADDDFSSAVALRTLELLEQDDDALIRRCGTTGEYLLGKLRALQQRYPGEVRGVRGRGLMIGFELTPQDGSSSPLLRVLSDQDLLGFMVSGYLLHEERIRVAPTLSARATIRLEPSAYLERADCDRLCAALERLLDALHDGDAYRLLRFLVGRAGEHVERPRRRSAAALGDPRASGARVGFLAHFLEPGDMRSWDPSVAAFTPDECERFFERTRKVVEPFLVARRELRSAAGTSAQVTVIAVPFTPTQVVEAMQNGTGEWATAAIDQGVELARRLGCSALGFGGYTSILTNNCRSIVASDLALTSGNSLTAAAALEAMFMAARRLGVARRRLGVVGAAGNIGMVLAEVAADEVDEVVLVGRERARGRLAAVAAAVYAGAWLRGGLGSSAGGVAGVLSRAGLFDSLRGELSRDPAGAGDTLRRRADQALGAAAPVRIATDMSALRECDLVISATNSARPVVLPEHIADRPVVISDVAVPRDVDPRMLRERPRALVLRGGTVTAPLGQRLDIDGMNLAPGEIYGCLAETMLMGFAGIGENFSYGRLLPDKVRRVRELARMHGFSIDENPEKGT